MLLLGCPAVEDGLVEQQRRKGEIEKEKKIKNKKKMCAEKILKLPPAVVATWLVINLGKATYC